MYRVLGKYLTFSLLGASIPFVLCSFLETEWLSSISNEYSSSVISVIAAVWPNWLIWFFAQQSMFADVNFLVLVQSSISMALFYIWLTWLFQKIQNERTENSRDKRENLGDEACHKRQEFVQNQQNGS